MGVQHICRLGVTVCVTALTFVGPPAGAKTGDEKPTLGFSIAQSLPGALVDGPLFQRMKAAIAAANARGDGGLASFLAPHPSLVLSSFSAGPRQDVPFTAGTIRAASQSCIGPWAFDEGASWVQLSWICSIDKNMPLTPLLTFATSPELSLTVWFENGRIKRIEAMEPLAIPGARRLAMGAFCAAVTRGAKFAYPSRCPQAPEAQ